MIKLVFCETANSHPNIIVATSVWKYGIFGKNTVIFDFVEMGLKTTLYYKLS